MAFAIRYDRVALEGLKTLRGADRASITRVIRRVRHKGRRRTEDIL